MLDEVTLGAAGIGLEGIALRLGVATILGFLVGLDREYRGRALGLRTNMLVSVGACLFGVLAVQIVAVWGHGPEQVRLDPTRVVEGIIGGIGFLGAGAILHARGEIKGATTGATIWAVGGVGLAVGLGFYATAIGGALIILFIVTVLGIVERRLLPDGRPSQGPPD